MTFIKLYILIVFLIILQISCQQEHCKNFQKEINLSISDDTTEKVCVIYPKVIKNCEVYEIIDGQHECKVCQQYLGYSLIQVGNQKNGKNNKKCMKSNGKIEHCKDYHHLKTSCGHRCKSCHEERKLVNVQEGFKTMQKCIKDEDVIPGCGLYSQISGIFYCVSGYCIGGYNQIYVGTSAKQIVCTTLQLFNESNGKGQCQIYQRPISTDASLSCSQCKDSSQQLPYCTNLTQ